MDDILTVADITSSSDISEGPKSKNYDTGGTHYYGFYTCTTGTEETGYYSKDDYLIFAVTVKNGYTFTPTSVTLKAIGIGTGNQGANIFSTIQTSSAKSQLGKGDSKSQTPTDLSLESFSKTIFEAGETLLFYVHIGSKADGGSVGLRDVVLSGTYTVATPVVKYDVTYKANGSGEADVVNNVSKVDDNMFTYAGHAFAGWNTAANGSGISYAVGDEVTSDLTLFAQWVNSATLFSMTDITGPATTVAPGEKAGVEATFSSGASAEVYNGHATANATFVSSDILNINSSGASYLHITLTTKLQAGDIIEIGDATGAFKVGKTTSQSDASTKTFPYEITGSDGFSGLTELYFFKDGSATLRSLTITGSPEASDLTITSTKTPEVAIGTESTIEYTTSSSGNTTFACSDESVATVSNDGVITGVGAGTATITLTQAADGTYRAGFAKVTVTVPETALVRAKLTGSTTADMTGEMSATYSGKTQNVDQNVGGCKLGSKENWTGFTLNGNNTLQTGDIVEVKISQRNGSTAFVFYDSKEQTNTLLTTEVAPDPGVYKFVLPEEANGKNGIFLVRGKADSQVTGAANEGFNPHVVYIALYRPEKSLTLSNTENFNYGFGGFCGSANFTVTNGAAYKASLDENAITLTKIDGIVPANAGVIIVGNPGGTATINYTNDASTADMNGNILEGTTVRTPTTTLKGSDDKFLTLQKSTSKFIEYTGDYFPANRAYFTTNNNNTGSSKAMSFDIKFADATSVKNVEAVTSVNEAKAVKKAIVNGRLVIMTENGYVNVLGQTVK